jgi:hypothetical protein
MAMRRPAVTALVVSLAAAVAVCTAGGTLSAQPLEPEPPVAAPLPPGPTPPAGGDAVPAAPAAAPASLPEAIPPAADPAAPGATRATEPTERPPFYQRAWFWTVLGVVAVTAVVIAIGVSSQGPETPSTNLGNMRAF